MNLSKVKLVSQDDAHFTLHDGKSEFKVAKKGLKPSTHKQIVQHFSEGDAVLTASEADAEDKAAADAETKRVTDEANDARWRAGADDRAKAQLQSEGLPIVPTGAGSMADVHLADASAGLDSPSPAPSIPGATPDGVPPMLARLPDDATQAPGSAATPGQTPPATPAGPYEPRLSGGPDTSRQLNDAIERQKQAELAKANIVGQMNQRASAIQDAGAARRAEIAKQFDADYAENEKNGKQLAADIASGKFDPNTGHYWAQRGTAGRIASTIGVILGGIGAGMTHGQNQALHVVQNAIDRDMKVQELQLENKKNQLSYYMQRGHSLQVSRNLAMADNLDAVNGQLQAAATKYAGPQAQANAQQAIGVLDQNASTLRRQAYAQSMDNKLKDAQVQEATLGMQIQRRTAEQMSRLTSGEGFDPAVLDMPAFKDYRERAVTLPSGKIGFARDKDAATALGDQLEKAGEMQRQLSRYSDLQSKWTTLSPEARGNAESLHAGLVMALGNMGKSFRASPEVMKLLSAQVPDLTDIVKPTARTRLMELGRKLDDIRDSALRQNVLATPKGSQSADKLITASLPNG